jgi:hypothetical protein
MAAFVEAHFANASLAFINQTAVPTGITLQRVFGEGLG